MYIDIFFLIFILLGVIQGFHRGLIRSLFAILGIVVGCIVALKFGPYVVTLLENTFHLAPLISLILGMVLTFLILMIGIRWIGKSFENTLKLVHLNFINKLAGAVLFAFLMVLMYSAIIWFIDRTHILGEEAKAESRTYPVLMVLPVKTGAAIEKLKPAFHEFWLKLDNVLSPEEEQQETPSKEIH